MMKNICLIWMFWLIGHFSTAQPMTIFRGDVRDALTSEILSDYQILLTAKSDTISISPLADGTYEQNLPVGRYVLNCSQAGYQPFLLSEILIPTGKEIILHIVLTPGNIALNAVEVTAGKTTDPLPSAKYHAITVEETQRFAATYLDPARLIAAYPGVATLNDGTNHISIRGNSPVMMQWMLEGVEIVNPNHLSNAGTFSDQPAVSGGGVNILSAQMLSNSRFYKGVLPVEYNNAQAGIMDMRLRKGNDRQFEYIFQAGLTGLDAAVEGPLGRKNSNNSFLANYRYSTVGLLTSLGVDFGDESINFQDLSMNLSFTGKKTRFSVFSLGGISRNQFTSKPDSLIETGRDQYDVNFRSAMGAAGMSLQVQTANNGVWNTTLVFSGINQTREASLPDGTDRDSTAKGQEKISFRSMLTWPLKEKLFVKAGLNARLTQDRWLMKDIPSLPWRSLLLQPFASLEYRPNPALLFQAGLNYSFLPGNTASFSLDPRLAISYHPHPKHSFLLAAGQQSQALPPYLYTTAVAQKEWNDDVRLLKSRQLNLDYYLQITPSLVYNASVYYQQMNDVPVFPVDAEQNTVLNMIEAVAPGQANFDGTGNSYGIENSLQQWLTKKIFYLVNVSLLESNYSYPGNPSVSTRFNTRYISNLTVGYEWKHQRKSDRVKISGINIHLTAMGGNVYTPIDLAASIDAGQTVWGQPYSARYPGYFRTDVRVYRRWNKKSVNRMLSIDIQNVTNQQNLQYIYFDPYSASLIEKYHLGIIPLLTYRWEF